MDEEFYMPTTYSEGSDRVGVWIWPHCYLSYTGPTLNVNSISESSSPSSLSLCQWRHVILDTVKMVNNSAPCDTRHCKDGEQQCSA